MDLILDQQNLKKLPKLSSNSYQEISVYHNQLRKLPLEIWGQQQLETLNISANQLTQLSKKIGNLQQLRMLDLGHNQLKKLPKTIGNGKIGFALESRIGLT